MTQKRIPVESISRFLKENLPDLSTGTVHSVFSRTFNIRFGDLLVAGAAKEQKNLPFGFLVDLRNGDFFSEVKCGEDAFWDMPKKRLLLRSVQFDFSAARIWDPRFSLIIENDHSARIQKNISLILDYLAEPGDLTKTISHQDQEMTNQLLDFLRSAVEKCESPFQKIEQSLLAERTTETINFLRRYLGLGGGLTPFGDDFIIGLLGTLQATSDAGRKHFISQVCDALHQLSKPMTTEISSAFFSALRLGLISERLQNFISAIVLEEQEGRRNDSLADLLSFGSSSGIATVMGCAFGFNLQLRRVV